MKKKIFWSFIAILVIIQFFRPQKNLGQAETANDIKHTVTVPAGIENILKESCYDCHSNHTNYPWYFNVQPLAWWLDHHIEEGNHELNFSEFKTFTRKRQIHKMEEVAEQVKSGEMPMETYTFMHKEAALTEAQKAALIAWAEEAKRTLEDTLNVK